MTDLTSYLHEAYIDLNKKLEEELESLGEPTVRLMANLGYRILYDAIWEDGQYKLTATIQGPDDV